VRSVYYYGREKGGKTLAGGFFSVSGRKGRRRGGTRTSGLLRMRLHGKKQIAAATNSFNGQLCDCKAVFSAKRKNTNIANKSLKKTSQQIQITKHRATHNELNFVVKLKVQFL